MPCIVSGIGVSTGILGLWGSWPIFHISGHEKKGICLAFQRQPYIGIDFEDLGVINYL